MLLRRGYAAGRRAGKLGGAGRAVNGTVLRKARWTERSATDRPRRTGEPGGRDVASIRERGCGWARTEQAVRLAVARRSGIRCGRRRGVVAGVARWGDGERGRGDRVLLGCGRASRRGRAIADTCTTRLRRRHDTRRRAVSALRRGAARGGIMAAWLLSEAQPLEPAMCGVGRPSMGATWIGCVRHGA